MRNSQSIGVFDSGVGGTSIWKEIIKALPNENTIYLADIANAHIEGTPLADMDILQIVSGRSLSGIMFCRGKYPSILQDLQFPRI